MRRLAAGALGLSLALALAGCSKGEKKLPQGAQGAQGAQAVQGAHGPLPFVEDDYDRALQEAKRRKVPLFVDAWAPWCHTCLSLRAYVLSAPEMAPLAERFVWLAVDTEREKNQEFMRKFPIEFWPTLWVIDPKDERPVVRWPGSLNGDELRQLLDDAEQAIKPGGAGMGGAVAALLRAERLVAEGKREESIGAFQEALAQAPPGWPRRARAVDGLSTQLYTEKRYEACAALVAAEAPSLGRGTSVANATLTGLMCARKQKDKEPIERAAAALEKVAQDEAQPILADDRSSLFEELVDVRKEAGDKEGARRVAGEWSAMLEREASKAATPSARAVFDAHRMVAYLELGEQAKALALVEQSAKDFPGDYNHAARIAKVRMEMGQLDEALAAVDRSLALAYGPRKLRIFDLKAKILEKKGDAAGARAAREQGVREGEAMKLEGKQARPLDDLRAKLGR